MLRSTVSVILDIVLAVSIASAQNSGKPKRTTAEESWDNMSGLRAGSRIQVVDQKMHGFQGKFVSVSEESIALDTGGKKGIVSIARADVFRVTSIGQSKRRRNTWIGLAAGAGGGAAILGGAAAANCCNSDYTDSFVIGTSAGIGAGLGAALGSALGYALSEGDPTVYRAARRK